MCENKTLPINTSREARLISLILAKTETLHDLKPKVGSQNVAEVKRQLILKGWDILMQPFKMIDRDNITTYPGRYTLPVHMHEIARNSLAAFYEKAANDDTFISNGEQS